MTESEYLLTCLAEECAEVAQRVSKALRFGLAEVQPGQTLDNDARIRHEILDLYAVVEMLEEKGVLATRSFIEANRAMQAKKEKIEHFLAYSRQVGTVQP